MANIAIEGVISAIKAVVEGAGVVNREVAVGRFATDTYPELSGSELTKRARVMRTFDCRVASMQPHTQSCPIVYARQLYLAKIECSLTRHVDSLVKLDQATRDDLLGNQWEDVDVISQALTFPGNVDWSTANGGLVSRCLKHTGSNKSRTELGATPPNFIETSMEFEGVFYVNAN